MEYLEKLNAFSAPCQCIYIPVGLSTMHACLSVSKQFQYCSFVFRCIIKNFKPDYMMHHL